jgi:hypothetical protein
MAREWIRHIDVMADPIAEATPLAEGTYKGYIQLLLTSLCTSIPRSLQT